MTGFTALRVGLGVMYLLAPEAVKVLAPDRRARVFMRILGARHLIQAGATAAAPHRLGLAIGSGVDAVHAVTMAALALLDRRRRTAAFADAALASGLACAGWLIGHGAAAPEPT